ncbi:MAG: hypothetical protein DCF15_10985 [Phormidesmis priestleyi]|uniref:SLH domain-containing protein n=1 Tax=Phormidesmis priestleyi TaxID=268141 RepID=A0A2W4XDJ3_9CYAN|nr:MAG: hypothetical protein DCF15_10985 [Phormidesmis priestleyi]
MPVTPSKKIFQPLSRRLIMRLLIALSVAAMPTAAALRSTAQESAVPLVEFSDTQGYWAAACIERMGSSDYMKGYANRRFLPDNTMSRAEFAAVMAKIYVNAQKIRNAPQFTDVPAGFWAKDAIAKAYEQGLLEGYPNNQFKPSELIYRAQAITILAKAEGLRNPDDAEAILNRLYVDQGEIPDYARSPIAAATERRFVVNYPIVERLRPTASIVRGEVAAMLCQATMYGIDYRYNVPAEYVVTVVNRWRDRFVRPAVDPSLGFDRDGFALKAGESIDNSTPLVGMVNLDGQWVIEPRFDSLSRFSDGVAIGRSPQDPEMSEVIDQQGHTIFSTRYPILGFSEGLTAFSGKNRLQGFLDKTGAIVVPAQFFEAESFSEGLARVARLDDQGYRQYGFIDKTGAVVIPLQYKSVQETFQGGLVGARPNDSELWGYFDKTGEWAIAPQFTAVQSFSEGLAGATKSQKTNEQWGFIDRTGAFAIAPQYFSLEPVYNEAIGAFVGPNAVTWFNEGFATVRLGAAVGLIDRTGQWRISPADFEGLIADIGVVQGGIVGVQIGGDGAYLKVAQP